MDSLIAGFYVQALFRVCVDLDLSKDHPFRVWLGCGGRGFWQPIDYENIPSYCSHCLRLGHTANDCKVLPPNLIDNSVGRDKVSNVASLRKAKTLANNTIAQGRKSYSSNFYL